MKIQKQHLCDLPFCYAAACLHQDGQLKYLLATDGAGPCFCIDSKTGQSKAVWDSPGGTMSLVPIPRTNGDFLAVWNFLPGFNAQGAQIVHARCENGKWSVKPWLSIPFIHRFDILERNGVYYLLFCTLCTEKSCEEDWSSPGGLYAAALPSDFSAPLPLTQIAKGMTRNHGYCRISKDGFTAALTSCDQGVFEVLPPPYPTGEWTVTPIFDHPVSDIALCDIDGDGIDEMAVIEPFHGEHYNIYHRTENGFELMYSYPDKIDFAHVIWGGSLGGKPCFLGGCRGENKELFVLQQQQGQIVSRVIERGMGPANVAVIHEESQDIILTANRQSGEGAVFFVSSEE